MQRQTVVFILSCDWSGSTWVGYVLGSNPDSAFLGEFYRAWNDDLRQPCAWCAAHQISNCDILGDIERVPLESGFDVAFARTGSQTLVDTSKRVHWAERFLPPGDLRFDTFLVHLIRDPRGWCASARRRLPEDLSNLCALWLRENLEIRNFIQLRNAPSVAIFYDELATSPETGFAELFSAIGGEFDPSSLKYWLKAHHAFAANGASSVVLRSAPSKPNWLITGDDDFYRQNATQSLTDRRWQENLSEQGARAIREDPQIAGFLKLYDRVLLSDRVYHLTPEDLRFVDQLEGKFVRTEGATPALKKIYFIQAGRKHWVTNMKTIERVIRDECGELITLDLEALEKVPVARLVQPLAETAGELVVDR